MHHTVHTLTIYDETDADASAHGHVAERFFDVWVVLALRLHILKHGGNVHIRVKENALGLLIRSSIKAEACS